MKRLLFLLLTTALGASAMEPIESAPKGKSAKKHYMLIDNQGWHQPISAAQHMALMQCETYKDACTETGKVDFFNSQEVSTTKDKILLLAQCIENPKHITALTHSEVMESFELSNYLQAPSEICKSLAQQFLETIKETAEKKLTPKQITLRNIADEILEYPSFAAFWAHLLKSGKINDIITFNPDRTIHYNLSHNHLKSLGFRSKIGSSKGRNLTFLANPEEQIDAINLSGHAIKDFQFDNIKYLDLSGNRITTLHNGQLPDRSKKSKIILDNNPINTINLDFKTLLNTSCILSLKNIKLSPEQLQRLPNGKTILNQLKQLITYKGPIKYYRIGASIGALACLAKLYTTTAGNSAPQFIPLLLSYIVSLPLTQLFEDSNWYQDHRARNQIIIETDNGISTHYGTFYNPDVRITGGIGMYPYIATNYNWSLDDSTRENNYANDKIMCHL